MHGVEIGMGQAWYVTKRIYIQLTSLLLLNCSFLAPWAKGVCVPILHCYGCPLATFACPIGTLQYFVTAAAFPFLVFATMIATGVIFGKILCFFICPFGFFQDILFRLHQYCIRIPRWCDFGKYVSLIVFVFILTALFHEPVFCKICPAGILEAGIPLALRARFVEPVSEGPLGTFPNPILSMIGPLFWCKVAILLLFMGLSVIIRRPFCRMLCPAGALFVMFSKISKLNIRVLRKKKCPRRKNGR